MPISSPCSGGIPYPVPGSRPGHLATVIAVTPLYCGFVERRDSGGEIMRSRRPVGGVAGFCALLVWLPMTASGAAAVTPGAADPDAVAALPPGATRRMLVVGTKIAPPFVMSGPNGRLSGLSIALWQAVAAQLGLHYRYRRSDLPGLFSGLEKHRLNVSVAALTVTARREGRVDFTFPFYTTGLAIAVPATASSALWRTIRRILSWQFATALGALIGALLLVGMAVWAFERRRNAEEFGGHWLRGLGNGFWWAAVTMTTVGYGDKAPRTAGGRLIGLVWMFAAIIVISSFTAAIATSLTVSRLSSGIHSVNDLAHVQVATVKASAAAAALNARGIGYRAEPSLDAALAALAAGRTDAVVYDAPLLKYQIRRHYPGKLRVLARTFERQDYAFAVPEGSDLREALDRAILYQINRSDWRRLVARYVGS